MGLLEIIIIAFALSMDTFAVSITLGLAVEKIKLKELLLPGIYFGFFQSVMPLIGYFAGIHFAKEIHYLAHWIAFILLGCIGGKMIMESFSKEDSKTKENPFRFTSMLLLAIATSIDALAVGITFAFFEINIFYAILLIGFTTFCLSVCGVRIGYIFGTKFRSRATLIGGIVLVLIGVKILVEHYY
jgi:putative Mn2+ efflux pump MntP